MTKPDIPAHLFEALLTDYVFTDAVNKVRRMDGDEIEERRYDCVAEHLSLIMADMPLIMDWHQIHAIGKQARENGFRLVVAPLEKNAPENPIKRAFIKNDHDTLALYAVWRNPNE